MAQNGSSCAVGLQRELITLAQPRPGQARITNDYIETPLRPQLPPLPNTSSSVSRHPHHHPHHQDVSKKRPQPPVPPKDPLLPTPLPLPTVHRAVSGGGGGGGPPGRANRSLVSAAAVLSPVTSQPTTFKKDKAREAAEGALGSSGNAGDEHADSIICRECLRCKCEACRTPRPLPSKWICNDKFPCSAPALVDYCSCLCCVKGLFYHLTKDYEMDSDVSCADKPCSCAPHKCCLRWTCLGLLSLMLPCLCCYWPLRGCVRLCELGYSGFSGKGCNCNQRTDSASSKAPPEKRLLDSNSDC